MNKGRINKIADYIENEVGNIDMGKGCGCIVGNTCKMRQTAFQGYPWEERGAAIYYGLNEKQTKALFRPDFAFRADKSKRTDKELVVRTLRRFARLGKIIWR